MERKLTNALEADGLEKIEEDEEETEENELVDEATQEDMQKEIQAKYDCSPIYRKFRNLEKTMFSLPMKIVGTAQPEESGEEMVIGDKSDRSEASK